MIYTESQVSRRLFTVAVIWFAAGLLVGGSVVAAISEREVRISPEPVRVLEFRRAD